MIIDSPLIDDFYVASKELIMAEISLTEAQQRFLEQFSSLVETQEILADTELIQNLQKSIMQLTQGKTVSWEDAKVKLGLAS
jgi:hypothetical protein